MTLEKEVQERAIIFKIKCLTEMLHITKESSDKKVHLPTDELLFAIHQEIDQYLFGGDGYLTYVGKLLTMKEKKNEINMFNNLTICEKCKEIIKAAPYCAPCWIKFEREKLNG